MCQYIFYRIDKNETIIFVLMYMSHLMELYHMPMATDIDPFYVFSTVVNNLISKKENLQGLQLYYFPQLLPSIHPLLHSCLGTSFVEHDIHVPDPLITTKMGKSNGHTKQTLPQRFSHNNNN